MLLWLFSELLMLRTILMMTMMMLVLENISYSMFILIHSVIRLHKWNMKKFKSLNHLFDIAYYTTEESYNLLCLMFVTDDAFNPYAVRCYEGKYWWWHEMKNQIYFIDGFLIFYDIAIWVAWHGWQQFLCNNKEQNRKEIMRIWIKYEYNVIWVREKLILKGFHILRTFSFSISYLMYVRKHDITSTDYKYRSL